MSNLSVRGIDPVNFSALKAMAVQERGSVNALLLRLIDQGLGNTPDSKLNKTLNKPTARRYDDLDTLAGAWSAQDAADFAEATAPFEAVDAALWK